MSKTIFTLLGLLLVFMLALNPLSAGDEDMLSPYTKFDPETGLIFVPIDESSAAPEDLNSTIFFNHKEVDKVIKKDEETTHVELILISGILLLTGIIFRFYRIKIN